MDRKQALDHLIKLLPGNAARALLMEVERGGIGQGAKIDLLKGVIAEDLEARRPDKLRRAFTIRLEPFLVDVPWLMRSPAPIPTLISRVDAGALWHSALMTIIQESPELVTKIPGAEAIGTANPDELVDGVSGFVGLILADRLADGDGRLKWRTLFNNSRASFAAQVNLALPHHPVDEPWFFWICALLAGGAPMNRVFTDARTAMAKAIKRTDSNAQTDAAFIDQLREQVDGKLRSASFDAGFANLIPAWFINQSRRYLGLSLYLKQRGHLPCGQTARVALIGHIRAACKQLDDVLQNRRGVKPIGNLWAEFDQMLECYATDIANINRQDRAIILNTVTILTDTRLANQNAFAAPGEKVQMPPGAKAVIAAG
jgi:hypothetical protein